MSDIKDAIQKQCRITKLCKYVGIQISNLGVLKILENQSTKKRVLLKELSFTNKKDFLKELQRIKNRISFNCKHFPHFIDYATSFKLDAIS